ncbi:MAG: glycosyltransferase family 2 protein [Opitutales bacterium]|nr:glycosyltransferase family 2 protein [Opitutales bacterium]
MMEEAPGRLDEGAAQKGVDVSIIVPVFDEVATIAGLVERVHAVFSGGDLGNFEILFIDDGSRDGSWKAIAEAHKRNPTTVRGLRHRRNFGKAMALANGFAAARGEILVTMDADLQDQPEEIPKIISVLEDTGADVVSGWKQNRNDPLEKTLPSKIFNALTCRLSGIHLHDFNCGFKAYRADCAKGLRLYGELHRFIPILAHTEGFRVTEVAVAHAARQHGKSKYGTTRMVKGFLDLLSVVILARYLRRPGHFFGGLGLLFGLTGFGILAYLSSLKLFWAVGGIGTRPLFFLGMLLALLGVQLFSIGILGELIIKVSSRSAPSGALRERIG